MPEIELSKISKDSSSSFLQLARRKTRIMNQSVSASKWSVVAAFAAIYVIWGSTYLAIIFAIRGIPPFLMSGFRFLGAGIVLYCWRSLKGDEQPDFNSFAKNSVCGLLMLVGGTTGVAWAEQYLSSSLAAMIVTSLPFWFVLLDKRHWPFYFSNKIILTGLLAGVIGVVLLLASGQSAHSLVQHSEKQWMGVLAIVAGGIAWTTGSLFSKYKPAKNSILMNASIQLLVAGLFCMMISIFSGESKEFSFVNVNLSAWLGFLYLLIMGTLVAYLSYLWLLKVRPAAQVSTYVYINPVIAVLLGTLIAGDKISVLQLFALLIILTGVLFVNMARFDSSSKKLTITFLKNMKNIAPDIFRKRLLIEGYYNIDVDEKSIHTFFSYLAGELSLQTYGQPTVHATSGTGSETNQGYDAFLPLIDSGIYLNVWPNKKFISMVIYTCKDFSEQEALRKTKTYFQISRAKHKLF